ncbi:hypothetical protein BLA29_006981 [Euroglyphus maynei]|uniref:Uncharacterized protein n=1 Tax=Euroglyphus maynei TaxID=6958 RepID=A0A1Y3BP08_EURMA|nr:hypothetical protein BLA29_006981 [Euroglyphus maynei]
MALLIKIFPFEFQFRRRLHNKIILNSFDPGGIRDFFHSSHSRRENMNFQNKKRVPTTTTTDNNIIDIQNQSIISLSICE